MFLKARSQQLQRVEERVWRQRAILMGKQLRKKLKRNEADPMLPPTRSRPTTRLLLLEAKAKAKVPRPGRLLKKVRKARDLTLKYRWPSEPQKQRLLIAERHRPPL